MYSEMTFPEYQDLWVSVLSTIAIHIIKHVLVKILEPIVKVIRRPKKNETEEMAQIENINAIDHICKSLLHVTFAAYAFKVFHGKEWVPWYLGGADNMQKLCHDYPFTELDPKI